MATAGKRNKRLTIQTAALQAADAYGSQAEAWTDVATVWAEVRELSASESPRQKAVSPEASVQVTVLKRSGLTSKNRFLYGTRTLYPLSVVLSVDEREQICLCREQL